MDMDYTYNFVPKAKELDAFHNLNQIAKNMFDRYIIDRTSGLVLGVSGGMNVDKGTHFATYAMMGKLWSMIPEEVKVIIIESNDLFSIVRDHKKSELLGISIIDDTLCLNVTAKGSIPIGKIISFPENDPWVKHTMDKAVMVLNKYPTIDLNTNYIEQFMDGQLVIIHHGDMHFRAGKELIPNLANKSLIQVIFEEEWTTPDKFQVIFVHAKLDVYSYHVYTCLRY